VASGIEKYRQIAEREAKREGVTWIPKKMTPAQVQKMFPNERLEFPKPEKGWHLAAYAFEAASGPVIIAEPIRSKEGLFEVLHEISHHYYRHGRKNTPLSTQEWEASMRAFEIMRKNGIEIPLRMIAVEREHLGTHLKRERKEGKRIDRRVEEFVEGKKAA
jgi:hypothetical protein